MTVKEIIQTYRPSSSAISELLDEIRAQEVSIKSNFIFIALKRERELKEEEEEIFM